MSKAGKSSDPPSPHSALPSANDHGIRPNFPPLIRYLDSAVQAFYFDASLMTHPDLPDSGENAEKARPFHAPNYVFFLIRQRTVVL